MAPGTRQALFRTGIDRDAYLHSLTAEELLIGLAQVEGISVASKGLSFAFGTSNVDARQMADIFDLQDDIAKLVLQQILQHFEKLAMVA